jgi:glycosyltransferase involved in cell wall biosynthesis
MPLVSIITPVRNAASWLPECIRSVVEQNLTDWEWILVDDHSKDNSLDIIQRAADGDDRIKLLSPQGRGILPALEQALLVVQGKYVTRMDADDIMPPGRLRIMVRELQKSGPRSVVTGISKYFPAKDLSEGYYRYQNWLNENLNTKNPWAGIYRECVIASPNWLVTTQELKDAGGFDGLNYPEDYDLCFRWYKHGFTITPIMETTLLWREHPQRTSRISEDYNQTAFFKLKILRFLELDYDTGKKLCIWGSGKKAQITRSILRKREVGFISMTLEKLKTDKPGQHLWYRRIEDLKEVQILIAVYPEPAKRKKMESYLQSLGHVEGQHYWYL